MPPPARRPIELEPGTPLADLVTLARAALAQPDAAALDAAYQQAAGLAAGDLSLWSALAGDHVESLRKLGHVTLALRRCTEYLDHEYLDHEYQVSLRLQRAQIRSLSGDHAGAEADAVAIRAHLASQPDSLTPDGTARLHRVEGLSAAERGDLDTAADHLDAAWRIFHDTGDQAGLGVIELDRRGIEVRQGQPHAVDAVLAGEPPRTVSDYRLVAVALRRQLRYEEALEVLLRCPAGAGLDPALEWHLLYDLIVLLRLMRQDAFAQQLLPVLHQAVAATADSAVAGAAVGRLSAAGAPEDAFSPQFDRRVQQARRLITQGRLDEAERLLDDLRPHAHTDREVSTWHLGTGELQLARRKPAEIRSCAQAAVGQLTAAVARSSAAALVEVRVCALRSMGHAYARLDVDERATECWAQAHRLEEGIAARQLTDRVRIGMLQAVPDEYDERIRAAAEKLDNRGPEVTAAIVVAMEAARGATILESILLDENGPTRDLPRLSDLSGAWRWVTDIADGFPPGQVVWIMHSAPDRVHHAVLGKELLYYKFVSSQRKSLEDAIDNLMACWGAEESLELSIASGEFDESLNGIAEQVGVRAVIRELPRTVRRIAIVAGGELSDIPFAAVGTPGDTEPLGLRYALSDLPCLSARLPLHQRSLRLRGERQLLVNPAMMLDGEPATPAQLRKTLKHGRQRRVRIDGHGEHGHGDPAGSWVQLAPEGPAGRLRADDLQRMDLSGCGTLAVGACESGMAQRTGRDERVGFVRAAIAAGAAAVIAARWIAADPVAAAVLDRFDRYIRYLPRDLALQQAQRDVYRGAPDAPVDLPAPDHPARWACWTLYGDSGWQTGVGPVRRSLRRGLDQRRRRVAQL
ncbi:MAG: CHAT domain-containing protein [Actinomycetota bacterium]|nr:CHAT domain-containing protein [Actinomycetota bacterium]